MTDPRTLSELVPAQTLAKALLEAEEAMLVCFKRLQDGVMARTVHQPQNYCAATITESKIDEALAQIQRIKTGEVR